jgi:hypothetical protein
MGNFLGKNDLLVKRRHTFAFFSYNSRVIPYGIIKMRPFYMDLQTCRALGDWEIELGMSFT